MPMKRSSLKVGPPLKVMHTFFNKEKVNCPYTRAISAKSYLLTFKLPRDTTR